MSEKSPNIYQRLLAVVSESGAMAKTGKAAAQVGGYAFHKIDDVVEHLRPLLLKHGVIPLVSVLDCSVRDIEVTRRGNPAVDHGAVAQVSVTFVNAADPEDATPPLVAFGEGLDTQDKAAGKAMSYALKNLLLAQFQLRGQPDNEAIYREPEPWRQPPQRQGDPPWDGDFPQDASADGKRDRGKELAEKVTALLRQNNPQAAWALIGGESQRLRQEFGAKLFHISKSQVKVFYAKANAAGVDVELMKRYVYRFSGINRHEEYNGDHLELVPSGVFDALLAAIEGGGCVRVEQ